jgi:hypothetical protein
VLVETESPAVALVEVDGGLEVLSVANARTPSS